jgi:hypothetical protein
MPDNTLSTLQNIRTKVRRLTRTPSTAQLSDADIDSYINTFVLYDFPEHLRLFSLRETLTFYAQPFVDVYETNTTNPNDPLYNFNNRFMSIHGPIYIAGYNAFFSQSREQFFGIYPMVNNIQSIGSFGDGITTNFIGVIPVTPFLQNNVLFSSVDANGVGLAIIDIADTPATPTVGTLIVPNDTSIPYGYVDYETGDYDVTFPTAPAAGAPINFQVVPYVASRPQALLYYDQKFTIRPVPDQPYRIDMECYVRPTELLNVSDMPKLSQWWQYMAYGAAKKVFEDRMDIESVQMIMPEYKKQELLVLRDTIVQHTNERTATIYTEQTSFGAGGAWGWGGGNF